tara:strand:+ start:49 stop:252 length:204 start_codon:yes stop_codon:yes gene_type:complete
MLHLLFVICLAGFSIPASAHDTEGIAKKMDFAEIKRARLERLDKIRSCISQSNNFKQLHACKSKKKN